MAIRVSTFGTTKEPGGKRTRRIPPRGKEPTGNDWSSTNQRLEVDAHPSRPYSVCVQIPGCPFEVEPTVFRHGGYAMIFRGVHRATRVEAAIKIARTYAYDSAATQRVIRRLKREIEVQANLHHRHVMPVIAADPAGHWYAMPLAEGSLNDRRPSTEAGAASLIGEVALGLAHAHAAGFVHRDVTPNNILRLGKSGDCRWVVSDWGLVAPKVRGTMPITQSGVAIGTDGFRAPESYGGGQVDARADVYSLGRVAAWALTGQVPRGLDEVTVQHQDWNTFIAVATAYRPEDRPSSMHEMMTLARKMGLLKYEPPRTRLLSGASAAPQLGGDPCVRCGEPTGALTRCLSCGGYVADYV